MPQIEIFDIDQAFGEFASATAVEEANRFRTLPTGDYTIQVTKVVGQKFSNDDRALAHMTADVLIDGVKKGTVFFNASWIERRDGSGKLDGNFNRWAQILRSLYPDLDATARAAKVVGEVTKDVQLYPLRAHITESFRVQRVDGTMGYTTPRTEDELKALRATGAEAKNMVWSLSKV